MSSIAEFITHFNSGKIYLYHGIFIWSNDLSLSNDYINIVSNKNLVKTVDMKTILYEM